MAGKTNTKRSVMHFDSDGNVKSGGLVSYKVYVHGHQNVSSEGPKSPVTAKFVQGGRIESRRRDDTTGFHSTSRNQPSAWLLACRSGTAGLGVEISPFCSLTSATRPWSPGSQGNACPQTKDKSRQGHGITRHDLHSVRRLSLHPIRCGGSTCCTLSVRGAPR